MTIFANYRLRLMRLMWPILVAVLLLIGSADAAPPHPGLILRLATGDAVLPYYLEHLDEARSKGIDQVRTGIGTAIKSANGSLSLSPNVVGQFRVLAILVDFDDNVAAVPGGSFDSLIFGSQGATVSEYYREVSYDLVQLASVDLPSEVGWQRAPEDYAYYVNNSNGTGAYPNNSQKLVEDLVDLVDPLVDFSNYDNNDDGEVDGLLVIHAGRGAEYGGGSDVIWSHKWNINNRYRDGVNISSYTIQPEFLSVPGDQTIGVIAHELGHVFGLPDLYDTDYSSNGVGKWGLMSFGSWLGPQGKGESPSHLCAWSKMQLGWLTPLDVIDALTAETILNAEQNDIAYRLYSADTVDGEYFLIENRQRIGFDSYLPATGLLIWHIDDAQSNNSGEWYPGLATSTHYQVALEQADGLYELEHKGDHGDAGDPFPGSFSRTSFNSSTVPSSDTYAGAVTTVFVENISFVGTVASADLSSGMSGGGLSGGGDDDEPLVPRKVELAQNYPNPFNPSTTISFTTGNAAHALVEVFNSLGRKVATLLDRNVPAGQTSVLFDAVDDNNGQLASGVYYYRIVIGKHEDSKKMVLIR
ncbi:MAG: M6 family metalloprotease domain-containing protein [candidate division Zixibacteria bacterium]|nr:M6 family metalloprotease domain-containing protein [candidate division Zixibacteria bacterium]MDH3937760.1 M6 family metalloprotease domain-containing protein [candidate division Zixibacteria bacterium]MDH4034357.1 M6 family metalloprotease domain-containing protein [candidate division Zixibacteria bacterium]